MVCCCDFSGKVPAVGCVDDVLDEHPEFASFFAFVHHFLNSFAHINHFRALWNVSVKMPRFKDGFKRGMVNIEKVVSEEKIRQLSRSIMDVLWFSLWNKAE